MRAAGIDVSHHKPVKDWDRLVASGVSFVACKATEGLRYLDPTLRPHQAGFRSHDFALGIYYHFARSGDAADQAGRLIDAVGDLRDHERLCLDLEVVPVLDGDADASLRWVDAFIKTILNEVQDRRPIVYTSRRIWRQIGDPAWEMAYDVDLWVPRYNAQGLEPALPKPWQNWTFWQWTDGAAVDHVTPGVGRCDANWFNGDLDELRQYANVAHDLSARHTEP